MSIRAVIKGIGHCVPDKVLTNQDLEKMVDTNDEWIVQRTGIKERRICSETESASTLAIKAAENALKSAGISANELDQIIVGTVTGDYPFPSTSCLVQEALGAPQMPCMDLGAACAGFIYSLGTATAFIESGHSKRVLVVGVDALTKYVDFTDRSTCVLFGDGAGAVVVEAVQNTDRGVLNTVLLSDGAGACHIDFEVGGSKYPARASYSADKRAAIYMNGNEVYRFAVKAMPDACLRVLEQVGLSPNDIDLFVPHQANLRIIENARERLGLPEEKVFVNVHKYGNTSGGSIPLALSEAAEQGLLSPGKLVMTVGFGAGLVWGANLIRW